MPKAIRSRTAFTLIELLVVIGIIVILVGILLPVVSTMRRRAQSTDTLAEITRIATACHNYYADFTAFPGPVPDSMIYGFGGTSQNVTGITGITQLTSTENLVLGLEGGITPPTTAGATTFTFTLANVGKGPYSLNYMAPRLIPPYYDATGPELANNGNGTMTSWTTVPRNAGGGSDGVATGTFVVPEFMDHYSNPHPIVYVRAVVGGNSICDTARSSTSPGSQYFYYELNPYWRVYASVTNLATPAVPTAATFSTPDASGTRQWPTSLSFFTNTTINDGITPRSKDSFILISAGYDGIYGTTDDNFYSN